MFLVAYHLVVGCDLSAEYIQVESADFCSRQEGYNFSDAEQNAAIKLLDKNGDKLIQFSEFVDWWQNEVLCSVGFNQLPRLKAEDCLTCLKLRVSLIHKSPGDSCCT